MYVCFKRILAVSGSKLVLFEEESTLARMGEAEAVAVLTV